MIAEEPPEHLEVLGHIATLSARSAQRFEGSAAARRPGRATPSPRRRARSPSPALTPDAASPSSRSSRSWNASPSGRPKRERHSPSRRRASASAAPISERSLDGVATALRAAARRAISGRRPPRRPHPATARSPCPRASGDTRRGAGTSAAGGNPDPRSRPVGAHGAQSPTRIAIASPKSPARPAPRAPPPAPRTTWPSTEPPAAPSPRRSGRRGRAPSCAGARAPPRPARSARRASPSSRHRRRGSPSSRTPGGGASRRLRRDAGSPPPTAGPPVESCGTFAAPPSRNAARAASTRSRAESSVTAAVSQGPAPAGAGAIIGVAMLFTRPRFRSLALVSAIATIVLFAIGGLVRGTGSGLGCSTWPACEPGHLFPSGTVHSLIEFSHRSMAFLVVVLTALTGLAAIRRGASRAACFWPAVLRVPAGAGPGRARRRGGRHGARPLVGHRALRHRPALDRRRDVAAATGAGPTADAGVTDGPGDPIRSRDSPSSRPPRRRPPARRHLRAGERRATRVHRLAPDGREARPDARAAPPPRCSCTARSPRSRCCWCCGRRSGPRPPLARQRARPTVLGRPRAVRRPDHGRRGQRLDTAPAVGRRRPRRAVRPDLGHGRRARDRLEARGARIRDPEPNEDDAAVDSARRSATRSPRTTGSRSRASCSCC